MGYIPGLGNMGVGGKNYLQAVQAFQPMVTGLNTVAQQIQQSLPGAQQTTSPSWGGYYNTLAQQLSQGQGGQPYTMPMSMVNPWLMGRSG